jgi:hypothetical protein
MEQRKIDGLTLFFEPAESEAADLVEEASRRSLDVIAATWGLAAPRDCRLYVMTSWLGFLVDSAPGGWRLVLAITFPLWAYRTNRMWPYAAGWMQPYGRRQAVGIKPPRLLEAANRKIGERVFLRQEDVAEKVSHATCHELAHAFMADLRLPSWLNEGLAMVTVDRFFGRPTVRQDTLEAFGSRPTPKRPSAALRLNPGDAAAIVRHYVRGYWIARLLVETDLEAVRSLLLERRSRTDLERRIAAILGISREALWREADARVLRHFSRALPAGASV